MVFGSTTRAQALHKELAPGTTHAIYRQALRFIPDEQPRPRFFLD